MVSINWYPGHMVKARREIEKNLKMVDIVLLLLDARAPLSCRNQDLERLAGNKRIIMVFNKVDLAHPGYIKKHARQLEQEGFAVALINSLNGQGRKKVLQTIRAVKRSSILSLPQDGAFLFG
jgi:ribosome biogenesis GTPase A